MGCQPRPAVDGRRWKRPLTEVVRTAGAVGGGVVATTPSGARVERSVPPRRGRGAGTVAAAVRCLPAFHRGKTRRRTGRFLGGTFVPVSWRDRPCALAGVGAGIEPATLGFTVRCSTHLSYPVVDEPDSNRWPTACAAALPLSFRPLEEHLLPRFGIRHGSAVRTGRDRNPYRCSVVDRCSALPAVANRQSVRARCALVVSIPRAARVEASQRGAHAPVAAAPLPRGARTRYPDAPGRKETSVVEWKEPGRCMRILRERWKQNAPGTCDPRAFAFLGRSG